jgi:hypothetical protein
LRFPFGASCLFGLLALDLLDTPLQTARLLLALFQLRDVVRRPDQLCRDAALVPHQGAARLAPTDRPVAGVIRSIFDDEPRDCIARQRLDFAHDALVIVGRDIEPIEPLELPRVDVVFEGDLEEVDACVPQRELDLFVQHPLLHRPVGLHCAFPRAVTASANRSRV